jgi:hypothetical protein
MKQSSTSTTLVVIGNLQLNCDSPYTIKQSPYYDVTYITHIHNERIVATFGKSNELCYFILTETGSIYTFGSNSYGSCGVGLANASVPVQHPLRVKLPCKAVSAQTGMNFSMFLCEDGKYVNLVVLLISLLTIIHSDVMGVDILTMDHLELEVQRMLIHLNYYLFQNVYYSMIVEQCILLY